MIKILKSIINYFKKKDITIVIKNCKNGHKAVYGSENITQCRVCGESNPLYTRRC